MIRAITIGALLVYVVAIQVHAVTITVTNINDSGPGSLRQALVDANDGDTIDFAVAGSIILSTGELVVDKSLTILGPGAANVAVSGNAKSRVFHVSSGKIVSISSLTITNGNACCTPPDDNGGGIYNDHATLLLDNCLISGNVAKQDGGGGVWNDQGSLTISNSILTGNSADGGGGVFNYGPQQSATLEISNSIFRNNSAGNGGAILNYGENGSASLDISRSTFSSNSAHFNGGAIDNYGLAGNANLMINESTLNDNSASYSGGGVFNDGSIGGTATMQLINSTLSGNSAGEGGGVYNDGFDSGNALLTVSSSTLNANGAKFGGGILNDGNEGYALLEIGDTILKAAAPNETIYNVGTLTSFGYNLSNDDGGGFLTGPGDQINTDPLLDRLRDNGGPTLTHRPFPGSPAIDAGDPGYTPPPFYDQRGPGFDRVVNGRIDVGSFEVQPDKPAVRPPPIPRPRGTPRPRPTPQR